MFRLRPYQIELAEKGLSILKEYGLVYLCCEVRTGKTVTSLKIADDFNAKKVLFLTKKKAIASIQNDFEALKPSFDLYVTNYEQAHTLANEYDLIILDESHSLSQYPKPAERTREVKKICQGKPVIFLSGSPTPESYSQLYHQLYVSSCSPFKEYTNFYKWAQEYVFIKQKRYSHGIVNDYSNADKKKIDAATRHLFLTFTQQQAGFTQAVHEHVLKVKMQDSTYYLAQQLRTKRIFESKRSGATVLADTEVKMMGKLHQVYSGTVLTESGEVMCFDRTKADFIAEHFAGRKIAVFYKFRGELELLRWSLRGLITDDPEGFNQSQSLTFCSQIQSGREGINLSTADAIVMYNIDFAHVSYLQARARMQTRDRNTPCELYWVFADGGIEEKIMERVKAKQDYQLSHFRKDYRIIQHRSLKPSNLNI